MFFLPVTDQDRTSWRLKVPGGIRNSQEDMVTYHVSKYPDQWAKDLYGRDSGGYKNLRKQPNFPETACFSHVSPHYGQFELHCYPQQCTLKDFGLITEFFQILVAQEIVTPRLELRDGKPGVHLLLPQQEENPHLIYAALTAFRWADCHGSLVWEFVQHYQRGLSPFQILPYLIAKYVGNCNHSFIYSYPTQRSYYTRGTHLLGSNPLIGVAAKMYFQKLDPKAKQAFEEPKAHTNLAIGELVSRLAPMKMQSLDCYGQEVKVSLFQFERLEDALSPAMKVFYEEPNLNESRIVKMLQSLFTKESNQ